MPKITTQSPIADVKKQKEEHMTPEQRRTLAARQAKMKIKADQEKMAANQQKLGGLAPNSLFSEEDEVKDKPPPEEGEKPEGYDEPDHVVPSEQPSSFQDRNLSNMELALNPRPNARARWQRRMVIRDITHRGRPTKAMRIARSERSHLSRSHFFKTSMKKLAPLARQIAGKTIDEAILQMRFSVKKAARDVKEHLITARNEAIVARGMGLPPAGVRATSSPGNDLSITPRLSTQSPIKRLHRFTRNETNIYIAEAWTNRGPYGQEADYRAKGRVNLMRPPYTGLSVLLKEEKTRTRETAEKEAKALRRRMGKNMWTQLPDRPIVRQSQQVLW